MLNKFCITEINPYIRVDVCLYISEMNGSNDKRDRKEEGGIFCCFNVLVLPMKKSILFESRLRLVVNTYYKPKINTKNSFQKVELIF